jgi:2-iminobutanoate/2-iminopropanoate deaminase
MTTFGPYAPVRQAGNLLFVSGQIGVNPITKATPANVASQTEQALINLKTVLAGEGVTMNDVVKTTVFLTDMNDFAAMNEVYERAFSVPRPARSTVAIRELPRVTENGAALLVEIEAVAHKVNS